MKKILLLSLFVLQADIVLAQRDQALPEDTGVYQSSESAEQPCSDAASDQSTAQSDYNDYGDDCTGDQDAYGDETTPLSAAPSLGCPMRPLWNQLRAHAFPFAFGMASGAWLGCLETDVVSPLLSGCSDPVAVSLELGLLGTLTYLVYTDQDEDNGVVKELRKSTTMAGILAGLIAWYQFHG